jgi:hypothetical protein
MTNPTSQFALLRPDKLYLVDRSRRSVQLHGYAKADAPTAPAPLALLSGTQIAGDGRFNGYIASPTVDALSILVYWQGELAQSRLGWRSAAANILATLQAFPPEEALIYLREDRPTGQAISSYYDRAIAQLEELLFQRSITNPVGKGAAEPDEDDKTQENHHATCTT